MSTKIEWTDKTWNPIVGCSKVSPACDHCYAERMAARLAQNPHAPAAYQSVVQPGRPWTWNGKTSMVESSLETPLHWRKPCRVFVGSMTDLFHPSTPFEWIDKIIDIMSQTPHITYQILTKRPERMHDYIAHNMWLTNAPMEHVWFGVTVENQDQADKRIPVLLDTPAAVRFVSIEPMLGPVDLASYFYQDNVYCGDDTSGFLDYQEGLDWVIVGGETGPGARPMRIQWVLDLQSQCKDSGVPFFFKKWGSAWGKSANNGHISGELCREFPTTHGW